MQLRPNLRGHFLECSVLSLLKHHVDDAFQSGDVIFQNQNVGLVFFEAHDFLGRFVHFVFLGHQFLPQQADQRIISLLKFLAGRRSLSEAICITAGWMDVQ